MSQGLPGSTDGFRFGWFQSQDHSHCFPQGNGNILCSWAPTGCIRGKIPLLGLSGKTEPIRYIRKRKSIMGTESHGYGGWELPNHVCGERENPESWWCNSAGSEGCELGSWWSKSLLSLKAWEPGAPFCSRAEEDGCHSWSREKEPIHPSSAFLFPLGPPWIAWCPLTALLRSPIQMLISPRNTFTDICRNNVLPAIWASLSLIRLIHKINQHHPQGINAPT